MEIKINYHRPVQKGRLRALGRVRELTRSLAYAEGEVVNEEGKRVCSGTGTFFLTETMVQSERERL